MAISAREFLTTVILVIPYSLYRVGIESFELAVLFYLFVLAVSVILGVEVDG